MAQDASGTEVSEQLAPSLLTVLVDLSRWMTNAQIPNVVVGGVAVSLLGRPRFTRDIDALIKLDEARWQPVVDQAGMYGFVARIDNPVEFARRSRVLLLRHQTTAIDVDLMIGGLVFELDAIANANLVEIDDATIFLPRVEDLLIMKAIAHRSRDMLDIEGLLTTHPEANIEKVRQWVREFSTAITMPELLTDFDKLVSKNRGF